MGRFLDYSVGILFAIGITAIVGLWLRPAPSTVGRRELSYSFSIRSFSLFFIGFAAVAGYGGFQTSGSNQLWAFGLALFFGGFGAYWLIETVTCSITYDETAISVKSVFGEKRFLWERLDNVDFSNTNSLYIVRFRGSGDLKVSTYLSGLDEFLVVLNRKLEEYDVS